MADGGLVPDEMVIGIIADRIDQPDPETVLSSTVFRAPCRRPRRSTSWPKEEALRLDAVVELRVNESALLNRVETRVAEMRARGEEVRVDDTPEVLHRRLPAYREQTAPADRLLQSARACCSPSTAWRR